jgi:serine/threonine protein phosphatase PrpC
MGFLKKLFAPKADSAAENNDDIFVKRSTRKVDKFQTRPMQPPQPPDSISLNYALRSSVGVVREVNEDSGFALVMNALTSHNDPVTGLFIVADGMGGHANGEKASALAVDHIVGEVQRRILLPRLSRIEEDEPSPMAVMQEAFDQANRRIQQEFPGAGTTASVVFIQNDLLFTAHVGDSRIYHLQDGRLEAITRDHSLAQRMVEIGELEPEEARDHETSHVLYQAIGKEEKLQTETTTRRLQKGDLILLCTDGLWGELKDDLLQQLLKMHRGKPDKAADKLVNAANMNGGPDNITVVVIEVEG